MYTIELFTLQPLHFAKNTNTIKNLKKPLLLSKPMSWSCKRCTFLNSPSSKSTCQVCLSPNSPLHASSSAETPKWSCKACTFLNIYKNPSCEICGNRAPVTGFDDLTDIGFDEELDSSVGSVFLPLKTSKRKSREVVDDGDQGCVESSDFRGIKACNMGGGGNTKRAKLGGFKGFEASNKAVTVVKDCSKYLEDNNHSAGSLSSFKVLTYNVWFREDLEVQKRMKAIGDLIQLHSPEMICFQEVTPNIFELFQKSSWWKAYSCSLTNDLAGLRPYFCMLLSKLPVKSFSRSSFENSIMGRELCIAELEVEGNKTLVIATSHLESPSPAPPKWDQMFSKERVAQANEAIDFLKNYPNVIFGGDMNWDDKLDGQFPLLNGWVDAWKELKPGDNGWTYDTKSNQMLTGNRTLQKRLDRFICNLSDFKISRIDMIGKEAIPGVTYIKEKKVRQEMKLLELPVLPSDHYGLLLTVSRR